MTTVVPRASALAGLLPAVVRLLCAAGAEAVDDVVQLSAQALGCEELVLRDAGGPGVVARAQPSLVPSPRHDRQRWALDAPVRRRGSVLAVLTATAGEPFTPERASALTAVADVLALALAADRSDEPVDLRRLAGQAVLDSEADRAQLATALHDRVAQDLVALQYTAEQISAGKAAPGDLREPVRTAVTAYRQAQRDLRAHALEAGLRSALAELGRRVAADRPDDGQPPLRVTIRANDALLDELPPPVAVTVERVAEAVLRGATSRASVFAAVEGESVKLRVDSADIACDASEMDRWNRRVSALGGLLRSDPDGVTLTLPAATEGSHDDGPHL
ncbi:MAG TPA: histidine kinase [Mycobacteriales bacterium]|nr:histidine kinase [Mycobacteriales bacterium]